MATKDIGYIYNRLENSVKLNFAKPLVIDGVVRDINCADRKFTISNETNDKSAVCSSMLDVSQLREGDYIRLKGYLTFNPNDTPNIGLNVEYFYVIEQHEVYAKKLEMYNKLKKVLIKDKCQEIIKRIQQTPEPEYIFNIGVVNCCADKSYVENFINSFKEKCTGEIFIYHTNGSNFRSAIEYFKKYHYIHLICILSEKMTAENVLAVSTKENVAYMLNRKNTPYIVSVVDKLSELQPHSARLSNKSFHNIGKCIEFIQNNQANLKKSLSDNIDTCTKDLHYILNGYRIKLFGLEQSVALLNDVRFRSILKPSTDSPFEQLRNSLVEKLSKERIYLGNIESFIMKKVIEDPMVKAIYTEIIESKAKKNNPETKKIENKTSDNLTDNTKLNINIQRQNGEF